MRVQRSLVAAAPQDDETLESDRARLSQRDDPLPNSNLLQEREPARLRDSRIQNQLGISRACAERIRASRVGEQLGGVDQTLCRRILGRSQGRNVETRRVERCVRSASSSSPSRDRSRHLHVAECLVSLRSQHPERTANSRQGRSRSDARRQVHHATRVDLLSRATLAAGDTTPFFLSTASCRTNTRPLVFSNKAETRRDIVS